MSELDDRIAAARLDVAREHADELARLASRVAELEGETQRRSDQWVEAIGTLRAIGHAVGCEGDELAVLAAVRRMAGELATLKSHPDEIETTKLLAANTKIAKLYSALLDLYEAHQNKKVNEAMRASGRWGQIKGLVGEANDRAFRAEVDK